MYYPLSRVLQFVPYNVCLLRPEYAISETKSQLILIYFVCQQLLVLLEHSITFPAMSIGKNPPPVLHALEPRFRTRKDSKTVSLATEEKQPRVKEPAHTKTVWSRKIPVPTRQVVRRYRNCKRNFEAHSRKLGLLNHG